MAEILAQLCLSVTQILKTPKYSGHFDIYRGICIDTGAENIAFSLSLVMKWIFLQASIFRTIYFKYNIDA